MSKPDRIPYAVMVSGVTLGYIVGGRTGFALGSVGLIGGLGYLAFIIASSGKGDESDAVGSVEAYSAHEKTQILLMVRDVHARGFPESDSSDLDVFISTWLVSETEFDLAIRNYQLKITTSDGSTLAGERISGDLDKWRVGREKEESDMWDTHVTAVREPIPELNTAEPLQVGIARQGWLHFRVRNITPEQFRTAPMELSVEDSLSHSHVAVVNCARNLPGKVWPIRGGKARSATQ